MPFVVVPLVTGVRKPAAQVQGEPKPPSTFRGRLRDPRIRRWAGWSSAALFGLVVADVILGTPSASEIARLASAPQATAIYDINNQPVYTVFKERRLDVPLAEVSKNVIAAVLAIEDQRFYEHDGIDLWRVGGAAVANIKRGEIAQGGSTITMQLARKSFLTDERTFRRKLKEAFLAQRIEHTFTKDQILEMYLNRVYFGDGYYGVEAAARGYFAKSAKALTVDEGALLAGLIKAPSMYAPTSHLTRALARRALVLKQMASAGFIQPEDAARLEKLPVQLKSGFTHERTGQYLKNHITRLLVDMFGWDKVSQGGLKVYATVDANMQKAADTEVTKGLEQAEKMRAFRHPKRGDAKARTAAAPAYLQGALIAMDPATGEVRAMVGGRNYDESQLNRAMQTERQAGSAFKPFVYAAAIESGYSPATLVTGLDDPVMTQQGAWIPADGHSSASAMTVRTALRTSSNRAAVQVLKAVGIPTAVSYAGRLGLEAPSVPSMVLGSGEVSLLSMTAAYGAFANGGWLRTPIFIRRVEDPHGTVIYTGASETRRAVSEHTAFLMANMLADVVNSGTGYRTRQAGFTAPAAGKTGTTNDYRDAWFIGFTPTLVTGVWVGFDDPKTIVAGGYAGELAAPIWGRFMKSAVGNKDARWLKQPDGIVSIQICKASGALPTEGCLRGVHVDKDGYEVEKNFVGSEYFRAGTEPTTECPIHGAGPSIANPFRWIIGRGGDPTPAPPKPQAGGPAAAGAAARSSSADVVKAPDGPPASTRVAAATATPPVAPVARPETPKKKGFWSRLKSAIAGPDRSKPDPKPKPGAGGS
jgi:1A family penicillin-binding protein